ncbi:MAG: esterase-like activity of phytase family protein [Bacteroidetes bacterium]|nr:esterase-like activity of phytase family protein [Bacteroidota bacterium]
MKKPLPFLSGIIFLFFLVNSFQMIGQDGLSLEHVISIPIGEESAAEIVSYDLENQRLWILNSPNSTVDIYDFSDYQSPVYITGIDFSAFGDGVTHIDIHSGIAAMSVAADPKTDPGKVMFINTDDYSIISEVSVGALPDMVKFTHDGMKVLVANEGEPSDEINPEGSISIIDISGGAASPVVNTASFSAYNEMRYSLINRGIRIFDDADSVAQDIEPEFITISEDDAIAYVSLQENNGLAVVDIAQAKIVDILPLGLKDHSKGSPMLEQYFLNELLTFPVLGTPVYTGADPIYLGGFSGLYFDPVQSSENEWVFYAIPDRGPNSDAVAKANVVPAPFQNLSPFKLPEYQARIVKLTLDKTSGTVTLNENDFIFLFRQDGTTPISGRGNVEGFDEVPVAYVDEIFYPNHDYHDTVNDVYYHALPYDFFGGDFEGIFRDNDRNFWMCDEYRPAIYKFNENGILIERFVPQGTGALGGQPAGTFGAETLPEVYKKRWTNRGFEAIAFDPDQEIIYAFIQSPMYNPNSSTKNKSDVLRILGIDMQGNPVSEHVYLLERNRNSGYALGRTDKIGDAVYAGNGRFYVFERDSSIPGEEDGKKYVFMIDLNGATDILGTALSNKMTSSGLNDLTLEMYTADNLDTAGIQPVYKIKMLNLPSIGYMPSDKAEGLTLLPDGSLAVLNDNDFGISGAGISDVISLGIISFDENFGFDASDKADLVDITNHPTWGMHMPDALGTIMFNDKPYVITVNEGDSRDAEEERVKNLDLNPDYFPNMAELQNDTMLGRLKLSMLNTDINNDGQSEYIHSFGARSFSIFDRFGNMVFDNGDDFEQITFSAYPDYFNCNFDEGVFEFKARSDDKGPEPEGLATGKIEGYTLAFIGLERTGGIMMYDVTNPLSPLFLDYINTADFPTGSGDISPEGLYFISKTDHPSGKDLLVVGYEISGTLAVFEISGVVGIHNGTNNQESNSFKLYPNPSKTGIVYFNKTTDISVYSLNGQLIRKENNTDRMETNGLGQGIYIVKDRDGFIQKLTIVR